jgi:hypothetical protein
MMTPDEVQYALKNAYIPEQVPPLLTGISGAEAFLVDDHVCCRDGDWVILIGYPLAGGFCPDALENLVAGVVSRFRPRCLSLMAPCIPKALVEKCLEYQEDRYYTREVGRDMPGGSVARNIRHARNHLTVEVAAHMVSAHHRLMTEFVGRARLPLRVRRLMTKLPEYVSQTAGARVLNAWSRNRRLAAFYVLDLAAERFVNYIFGCYSRKAYVRGASDLLTWETVRMGRETGKDFLHLGLGVHAGIRRFKEKWGAEAAWPYELCELELKKTTWRDALLAVMKSR